jgi:hypothetical protein
VVGLSTSHGHQNRLLLHENNILAFSVLVKTTVRMGNVRLTLESSTLAMVNGFSNKVQVALKGQPVLLTSECNVILCERRRHDGKMMTLP